VPSAEQLLQNPGALCNMVRRIVLEAGEIVLKYFESQDTTHIESKADGSPVSIADREAETFITMSLHQLLPDVPVIGEEAAELGKLPDLTNAEYFWLVDPLDGTKEFISGGTDFTVNVALIHKGEPVLGVVYAPEAGYLYAGHGEGTALRWSAETEHDKFIKVRKSPKEGLTVVSSLHHGDGSKLEKFLEQFKIEKILKRGSSLKICSVAEGKADIYPRFGPTCEWDTAAGDAVLRAAGGVLTDLEGKPLTYGHADRKFLNPEFVACSFEWFGREDAA
jgi:3'(2'), 5'-bisphosphate nucleotidase